MNTNYIKKLNINELIKYLLKQKFTTEAQMIQSRNIDGERFLNFTELDLVHWKLNVDERRLILNCRNKVLAETMIPKRTVPIHPNLERQKLLQDLDAALKPNKKEKRNTLKNQRPLPAPPKEIPQDKSINSHNALSKSNARQSLQYVDMNQGKTKVEEIENCEYVDMNSPSNVVQAVSSDLRGLPPKIPEKPNNLKRNSPPEMHLHSAPSKSVPKIQHKSTISNLNSRQAVLSKLENLYKPGSKPILKGAVAGNAAALNSKPDVKPRHQTQVQLPEVDEIEEGYLQPTDSPNFESFDCKSPPLQVCKGVTRNYPQETGNNFPPLPERPSKIMPSNASNEEESIYEPEPVLKSKPAIKGSIQDMPLPLIPNQTLPHMTNIPMTFPSVPNTYNSHISTEKISPISSGDDDKPTLFPKSAITKKEKNWSENKPKSCDITDLPPPPPPEFFSYPNFSNATQDKGRIWNVTNESQLPRPPKLNAVHEEHIELLRDLFADVDTPPSSDDENMFNPNNCKYYRNTDRKGARQLLETVTNLKSDTFLVRPSTRHSYFLGLTVFHNEDYYNLGIYKDMNGKFYGQSINEGECIKFDTLEELVTYYKYNALIVKKRDGRVAELYLKYFLPRNIY